MDLNAPNNRKNPRATKEQLEDRENHVLSLLTDVNMSAQDIAEALELSYPQTLLILGNLLETKKIERIPGRQARKILYTLTDGHEKVVAVVMNSVFDSNMQEIKVLGTGNGLFVSLDDIHAMSETTPPEHLYVELQGLLHDEHPQGCPFDL